MLYGLMLIALLIANLHAAVFYFFFILMMPYIGEYVIIKLRGLDILYKSKIKKLNKKIDKLSKTEGNEEKIEKLKTELSAKEEKHIRFKEIAKRREENPYRVKLVKRDAVKWLILVLILCFAMGMITPIGDEPYTHIFKLMHGNTTQNISEHQPLIIASHSGAITVITILTIMLVFTDTKISIKDLFMIGGLLILTFMSRRQFTMLVLVGGISLTKLLCDFADKYDKNGVEEFIKTVVNWKGIVVTIILTMLCSYVILNGKINKDYINSSSYPVEAAEYLLEEREKGNINFDAMKLFNDYNYGSYLLFKGIPVFIDSRADLYSPEFNEGIDIFSDYLDVSGIGAWYEDKFEKYGITHIMTYANSKLNMLLSRDENYEEIYKDDHFKIFERNVQ